VLGEGAGVGAAVEAHGEGGGAGAGGARRGHGEGLGLERRVPGVEVIPEPVVGLGVAGHRRGGQAVALDVQRLSEGPVGDGCDGRGVVRPQDGCELARGEAVDVGVGVERVPGVAEEVEALAVGERPGGDGHAAGSQRQAVRPERLAGQPGGDGAEVHGIQVGRWYRQLEGGRGRGLEGVSVTRRAVAFRPGGRDGPAGVGGAAEAHRGRRAVAGERFGPVHGERAVSVHGAVGLDFLHEVMLGRGPVGRGIRQAVDAALGVARQGREQRVGEAPPPAVGRIPAGDVEAHGALFRRGGPAQRRLAAGPHAAEVGQQHPGGNVRAVLGHHQPAQGAEGKRGARLGGVPRLVHVGGGGAVIGVGCSQDLDVIDVPAAVIDVRVRCSHNPADVHGGLAVSVV